MRTEIRCKHCSTRMAAKISLQGKQVRCPTCRNPVRIPFQPVVLPQLGGKPVSAATPVDDEVIQGEVLPEHHADFDVLPDEDPAPPARTEQAVTPAPEPSPVAEEAAPRRKKKKKKKRTSKAESETSIPVWMWLLGGVGGLLATGGIILGITLALRAQTPDGHAINWKCFAIEFCIMVPINVVILVLGMVISSALGGGINFGDAKTAILGSFFLVIVVVLVSLIPIVGPYLTLLVWLVGFMTIFGLDPWEARFLLFICWLLTLGCNIVYDKIQERIIMREMEFDIEEGGVPRRGRSREKGQEEQRKPGRMDPDDDDEQSFLQQGDLHQLLRSWMARQDILRQSRCVPG